MSHHRSGKVAFTGITFEEMYLWNAKFDGSIHKIRPDQSPDEELYISSPPILSSNLPLTFSYRVATGSGEAPLIIMVDKQSKKDFDRVFGAMTEAVPQRWKEFPDAERLIATFTISTLFEFHRREWIFIRSNTPPAE